MTTLTGKRFCKILVTRGRQSKRMIDPDRLRLASHSNVSRPFDRPESGCIGVNVINRLGDHVMKVFRV